MNVSASYGFKKFRRHYYRATSELGRVLRVSPAMLLGNRQGLRGVTLTLDDETRRDAARSITIELRPSQVDELIELMITAREDKPATDEDSQPHNFLKAHVPQRKATR